MLSRHSSAPSNRQLWPRAHLILLVVLVSPCVGQSHNPDSPSPGMSQKQADIVRSTGTLGTSNLGPADLGSAHTSILPDLFTGSLTASLIATVPPGIAAMTPSIEFLYRSSNGNGWIGRGWELEQGAITRNFRDGVSYAGDNYTFKSGAGEMDLVYADGWYWAKIESTFTRFKQINSDDGSTYWLATDP
jgi:hypothetical protein